MKYHFRNIVFLVSFLLILGGGLLYTQWSEDRIVGNLALSGNLSTEQLRRQVALGEAGNKTALLNLVLHYGRHSANAAWTDSLENSRAREFWSRKLFEVGGDSERAISVQGVWQLKGCALLKDPLFEKLKRAAAKSPKSSVGAVYAEISTECNGSKMSTGA